MKIINNQDIILIDELKSVIHKNTSIYIAINYITISAIFELLEDLTEISNLKILIDNDKIEEDLRFTYDERELKKYHELTQKYRAEKVYDFIRDKVEIREGSIGGQKFILTETNGLTNTFLLAPHDINLTTLGVLKSEMPIFLNSFEDSSNSYTTIFNNVWNNSKKDLKNTILNSITKASNHYCPDDLYKFTLHNIFQNKTIDEKSEQRLNRTGFKETEVWKMLFNFQKDAVLGAIDKIETFGGCIIADSVGLGKTFEALAVMKYYNLRNDRILVLCPKKLRENWLIYSLISDVRNILAKDRLNFDVLNHTDLSREKGISGLINLETINWGNYDLVVIDESHNFRNNDPRKNTVSRYQRLMRDIIKTGVKTKVLMLSATPVNTRMNDIKNQIAFITEQNDKALENFGIPSIDQTLRKAQQKFNTWLKENHNDNINRDSLVTSLNGDYFKILDLLTIARSRKHIEKYYDVSDIGKFPERLTPIPKYSDFDTAKAFPQMDNVNNLLNALNLKFYSPLYFVRDDKKKSYEAKYDYTTSTGSVFRQIEREDSLIHLMRVNLLKRLESSIHSFRLTLKSLLNQIEQLSEKIKTIHQNEYFDTDFDINEVEFDDDRLEDLIVGGKVKVLLQDLDLVKFKEYIDDDKKRLEELLSMSNVVDATRDAKLKDLKELIIQKLNNPINKGNKKVIVFSAFADTVYYLYEELAIWLKDEHGLYSALVTGGDSNKSNMPNCRLDLNSILIHFSPLSKKRNAIYPEEQNQIDILFCTDCISEGQNLQDCDFLVNYDIHWNPVRIIQRFGRIDRIGSINEKIQLVNFFPNLALDSYIDLIARVKGRMQLLDTSATGDDNVIDETAHLNQDLEYRRKQLKQLQNQVLDLEDIEGGISITDLTFNDFKIDADRLSPKERETFQMTPKGIFALTENNMPEGKKGAIFCLKDTKVTLDGEKLTNNIIYPYILCYVSEEGEIHIANNNPKRCLDYYKKLCLGQTEVLPKLISSFNQQTKSGRYMDSYKELLDIALLHAKGATTEMGINSLAMPGVSRLTQKNVEVTYELISFLIIK
ncbi:Type III restriction enzyme, res subunit [Flavobacterium fontis]|uniref:Type III restriction enzyme, res subunit n=1 Tax=Flavobacterium fontis TaxID=1124188 RepID=A0A1M5EB17_9FLAO|nr:helicase-related protein [Flavobacterium fontis]SHF76453.1 Type III restriction enzyme, res subunit [Flavobacterium fontis]